MKNKTYSILLSSKLLTYTKSFIAFLVMTFASAFIYAQDISVTLKLNDHDGVEITTGVSWDYRTGYSGAYVPITSGTPLTPKTNYNFRVTYGAAGQSTFKLQDINVDSDIVFQTIEVNVAFEDCDENALAGTLGYRVGYTGGFQAVTGPLELLDLNASGSLDKYGFQVIYLGDDANKYQNNKLQDVSVNPNVLFTSTTVNIFGASPIHYRIGFGGAWQSYTGEIEMLPLTYKFRFGGVSGIIKDIVVSGCSVSGGFLRLVDENGNAMENYNPPVGNSGSQPNLEWRYECNGRNQPWQTFQTDANGEWFASIGCSNWTGNRVQVRLNQTLRKQDVSVNSDFMAVKVNVNLKTCDGLILDPIGGTVRNSIGFTDTYGTTGTTGTVSFYAFQDNSRPVKIKMVYNNWFQRKNVILVDAQVNEIDFTTTAVTLNHTGDIKFRGTRNKPFNKPTMNLLPGNYKFKFKTGSSWSSWMSFSVSGCQFGGILANITLKTSEGVGLSGGVATYTKGGFNPISNQYLGTTDNNGNIYALVEGDNTLDKYYMVYNGLKKKYKKKIHAKSLVF